MATADLASSLLDAMQRWDALAACPLPRCPQWFDASAFLDHGRLMEQAFNTPPIPDFETIPVMYQGASAQPQAHAGLHRGLGHGVEHATQCRLRLHLGTPGD